MPEYYLNKNAQDTGEHEVHQLSCIRLPEPENRLLLGIFSNCKEAVKAAKDNTDYSNVDGCFYCANECHTR